MSAPATKRIHHANPLFLVPGVLLATTGVVLMVAGFLYAAAAILSGGPPTLDDLGASPDAGHDMAPIVNGFALVVVGCTVLTAGRYLWRGARRRGWRDRIGRLLTILGYVDIGAALFVLTRFVAAAFAAGDADSEGVFIRGLIVCLGLALPGMVITPIGLRMANEKILMTAEVKASL